MLSKQCQIIRSIDMGALDCILIIVIFVSLVKVGEKAMYKAFWLLPVALPMIFCLYSSPFVPTKVTLSVTKVSSASFICFHGATGSHDSLIVILSVQLRLGHCRWGLQGISIRFVLSIKRLSETTTFIAGLNRQAVIIGSNKNIAIILFLTQKSAAFTRRQKTAGKSRWIALLWTGFFLYFFVT